MKNLILASTSTLHQGQYLSYLLTALESLFAKANSVLFIPFARPGGISHEAYTQLARKGLTPLNKKVVGLHDFEDKVAALEEAEAIITGGGNTFVLVNTMYQYGIMETLRQQLHQGTPYLGTSAGSNLAGLTMQTTNDMPIVYPPSFKTLGMVPFNINAHYLDPQPNSTHMGETRQTRIKEFHAFNAIPVVGLREGSWIQVQEEQSKLMGPHSARIFQRDQEAFELASGDLLLL
ncbi:dipeptidase PepE [Croceiramulus getboli]|nr:dipeptidase PepE [Flavobacteriaceae bacterium YJPT1-3]